MFPERRILLVSYSHEFAQSWGRKARDVLKEVGYELYGVRVKEKVGASNWWETEKYGGAMFSTGIRGTITGKGANLLIIDDPVKNAEEARSKTIRDKNWDWYQSTAYTRLEPDGAVVLVMSRWHYDDLAGRCLKESGENWHILCLQAIAEQDEDYGVLKRKAGEPLWGERFSLQDLERIKTTIGRYWFNALYQQRPAESEGEIFKREYFRYFTEEQDFYVLYDGQDRKRTIKKSDCIVFQTVDLAITTKETSDYTVIGTFAVTPAKDLLVLDIYRARIDMPTQKRVIKDLYKKIQPAYIGIESQAYQLALIQELRQEGLPIRELKAVKDKVARALTVATRYESGSVYHLKNGRYLEDLEDELLRFPVGEHDDQVDVLSYAGIEIAKMSEPADYKLREILKRGSFYE